MSKKEINRIKKISKAIAAAGIILLLAGVIADSTIVSISNIYKYAGGAATVVISSLFIYPRGDWSHSVTDGQRQLGYIMTIFGITAMITSL